jgi:galactonate dehydratase
MKISGIRTYTVSVATTHHPRDLQTGELLASKSKTWLFLKIETDRGIHGWGDGSGEWLAPSVEPTLHDWKDLLVGQDPLKVVALSEDIANRLPWKGGATYGTAIAAINMALYDIAGKAWGVPVHTILGGSRRDRVRVYSNGGSFESPELAVRNALKWKAKGYSGIKGNPLENRTWPLDHAAVEHSVACVKAVREAVGDGFDILLDTHGSPNPEIALDLARSVAPYRPLFLEEPVKLGSIDALAEVSLKSPIPIATGEKIFTVQDFVAIIDRRACAILQPDLTHCFGITTTVEIARRAEHAQMHMAPHAVCNPVGQAATLHADAVMNNFLIQETTGVFFEQYDRFAEHDMKVCDGYMNIPDRPGLGVEVKEQDIARMPHEPMAYRQYRHADGSWKGW